MKTSILCLLLIVYATSCNTYYITTTSLKTQLERIDPEKISESYDFRLGLTGVLLKGQKNFYNGIDTVSVTDKNGVYFDSMFMKDSILFASKSHFLTLPIHRNFYLLRKVEVQK